MNLDPKKALTYAQKSSSLGDTVSPTIQATILDLHPSLAPQKMTLTRLQSIGSLISKIDPVFAYNATVQEPIKQSGFISIISGNNYLLVIPSHLLTTFSQMEYHSTQCDQDSSTFQN